MKLVSGSKSIFSKVCESIQFSNIDFMEALLTIEFDMIINFNKTFFSILHQVIFSHLPTAISQEQQVFLGHIVFIHRICIATPCRKCKTTHFLQLFHFIIISKYVFENLHYVAI